MGKMQLRTLALSIRKFSFQPQLYTLSHLTMVEYEGVHRSCDSGHLAIEEVERRCGPSIRELFRSCRTLHRWEILICWLHLEVW